MQTGFVFAIYAFVIVVVLCENYLKTKIFTLNEALKL